MSVPRACSRPTQRTSVGARWIPATMATTRNTAAFPESRPMVASETPPVCATPVTTARMIRPRMSSTTAAPRTRRGAGGGRAVPHAVADGERHRHADEGDERGLKPGPQQFGQIRLQADLEQQDQHTEVGQGVKGLRLVDEPQDAGTDDHSGQ